MIGTCPRCEQQLTLIAGVMPLHNWPQEGGGMSSLRCESSGTMPRVELRRDLMAAYGRMLSTDEGWAEAWEALTKKEKLAYKHELAASQDADRSAWAHTEYAQTGRWPITDMGQG